MNYRELLEANEEIYQENREQFNSNTKLVYSIDRTLGICEQNMNITSQFEAEFLANVKLTKKDLPFVFLAVGLQTIRWFLLASLDLNYSKINKEDRLKSNEVKRGGPLDGYRSGKKYEKPKINDYKNKYYDKYLNEEVEYRNKLRGNGNYQYISWIEILFHAVPYDAMDGSENISIESKNWLGRTTFFNPIGKQLNGKNHHVATLGHDPILGWIFGTMNIMSSTITFCDLKTFPVRQSTQLDRWQQSIDYMQPSDIGEMLKYCLDSFKEDNKRLPAAVARQAMHMQSDKYTKDGLPIPILSPDKAQKLINRGWNSNELERAMKKTIKNAGIITSQYLISEWINSVIRSIYLFLNAEDFSNSQAKVQKILTISNIMAECSNVAVVVATRNISKLDVGGLISMVHQIVNDKKIRLQLEMEYIKNKFNELIMEDEKNE